MTSTREVIARFIAELTRGIGGLLETSASTRPAQLLGTGGHLVTIVVAQGGQGELKVFFTDSSVRELVEATQTAGAFVDASTRLRGLCAQAAAIVDRRADACTLAVSSVERVENWTMPESATVVDIVLSGHEDPIQVAVAGEIVASEMKSTVARSRTLDVILDIDLPLVVRFGRTELPLRTLTTLGPGSMIDLGRSPDEPVEVLISNRVVARGDVVIVGGNYGVRVRDVVSPAERARTLEA